ncbi:hypothetical protein M5D96_006829, partial [Drosophila gunungcola]
ASATLTTTLDTAKETVGTAVAGITNELGNAFKEGTQALDEAKHKVMEGLHLEKPPETDEKPEAEEAEDADSLKTSTPEPEIERALANEEESPPTPKPSLEEMVQLSAEVSQVAEEPTVAATAESSAPAAEAPPTESSAPVESRRVRRKSLGKDKKDQEQQRPSTTEWEKFADQLAKSKKFKPYESFAHSQNKFSVYQDHTSLRDKPNHYDGHFSGGNSQSASQSDLSSGHITPAPTRRGQREFAKFVGSEQPGSISRSSSRLSNAASSRTFDFNPHRERISLPVTNRIKSGIQRAPAERISGWGRGKPAPLAEEPGYGRRMSTGVIPQPLRSEREKLLVTGSRRVVQTITPTKEKPSKKQNSKYISSRESSQLEFDSHKSPLRVTKPLSKDITRSREPSLNEFDALKSQKSHFRGLKPKDQHHPRNKADKSPLGIQKPLSKELARSRETFLIEFDSLRSQRSPVIESKTKVQHPSKHISSRELSYTELESQKTEKSPLRVQNPSTKTAARSREPSYIEFDSLRENKSPLRVQKNAVRSREPSYTEFYSFREDKSPLTVQKSMAKEIVRSREQSFMEFGSVTVDKSPFRITQPIKTNEAHELPEKLSQSHHVSSEHLPPRDLSPSSETQSPTNQNLSSLPHTPQKTEAPEAAVSTSKMPSPSTSRASSAKSSDSGNLDVIIQPMSSLNTPSIKSFTQSPDQVVIEGYEDSDLEAALARLEILRGSTATLHSLRSCSPGRHTYTSSLLSSRRTSPWVMRKNYGGSLGKEKKPATLMGNALKLPQSSHQTVERCDICYNEFLLN